MKCTLTNTSFSSTKTLNWVRIPGCSWKKWTRNIAMLRLRTRITETEMMKKNYRVFFFKTLVILFKCSVSPI